MPASRPAAYVVAVVVSLLASACLVEEEVGALIRRYYKPPSVAAGPRIGQIQATATTGGCNSSFAGAGVTNVSCGLIVGSSFNRSSTMQFRDLPGGTTIGETYGAMIVQTPASVSNLRGTYTGAGSGTLVVQRVTTQLYADNSNAIVAEPGTTLWILEPPVGPGKYTFIVDFDESGAAPNPTPFKLMFTQKVLANARAFYPPLFPCTNSFAALPALLISEGSTPAPVDLSPMAGQSACSNKQYSFGPTVQVVEFYNQALDHYFITWMGNEIALLDAGTVIKGWTRTGQSFKAYVTAQTGSTNICRIYIVPLRGDSHFFGRGQQECNDTMAAHPDFVLEDPAFMALFLPAAGNCPVGTVAVYRVFSNRPDANHRYMVDAAIRTLMVSRGWLAEGDGPNLVVMCAPA